MKGRGVPLCRNPSLEEQRSLSQNIQIDTLQIALGRKKPGEYSWGKFKNDVLSKLILVG